MLQIRHGVEGFFNCRRGTRHKKPDASIDIWDIANALHVASIRLRQKRTRDTDPRISLYPAADLWGDGLQALSNNVLSFNNKKSAMWDDVEHEELDNNFVAEVGPSRITSYPIININDDEDWDPIGIFQDDDDETLNK